MALLEQLGDLEAEREVEAPRRVERLREVGDLELAGRHEELGAIDPRAVVAKDVRDAMLLEHREPGAEPAPDVDDASRRDRVEDQRYGNPRRSVEPASQLSKSTVSNGEATPESVTPETPRGRLAPAPRTI